MKNLTSLFCMRYISRGSDWREVRSKWVTRPTRAATVTATQHDEWSAWRVRWWFCIIGLCFENCVRLRRRARDKGQDVYYLLYSARVCQRHLPSYAAESQCPHESPTAFRRWGACESSETEAEVRSRSIQYVVQHML